MKIIGKNENGFIATIAHDEIGSLLSINDARRDNIKDRIDIGTELTFTIALSNLSLLRDVKMSGSYSSLAHLKSAKEELDKLTTKLENMEKNLITVQEKIKTGQS